MGIRGESLRNSTAGLRWAVFISGTGSNLQAVLDLGFAARVVAVVSSKPHAVGLKRAKRAGIPTFVLDKAINWQELSADLQARGVQAIALCGFMRIVPPEFLAHWSGTIVNVHPSLLPAYPGVNSLRRAFDDNAPLGATVHEVVEGVDEGPVLFQKSLARQGTLEQTEFKLHLMEHKILREVIQRWKPAQMSS